MYRCSRSFAGSLAFTAVLLLSEPRIAAQAVASRPVVEWHQIFNAATLATVPVPSSLATSRSAALVSVSVFDAINGIDRWYTPYLVKERAPARTSVDAATIQAAYATLLPHVQNQVGLSSYLEGSLPAFPIGPQSSQ